MTQDSGRRTLVAWSLVVVLSGLAGSTSCVVESGFAASTSSMAVSGPPPEPMREMRPPPPDAQAVWIAGYWHWTGLQYTWIPGHWEKAPPGSNWHGPRYSIREGTYFYEPGTWSKRP